MLKRAFYLLPAMIMALLIIFWAGFMGGFGTDLSLGVMLILAITGFILVPALVVLVVWRTNPSVWIISGLFVLVSLFILHPPVLVEHPTYLPQRQQAVWTAINIWMIPITLLVAALLINSSLTFYEEWRSSDKAADTNPDASESKEAQMQFIGLTVGTILLSGLLLAGFLYNFYWLIIWDSAGDSLDFLWLFLPVMSAVFAGAIILTTLPVRTRLAGLLYVLLVPAMINGVYEFASTVDFRQLTEERAGRVNQAILAYQAREGSYPENLQQLIPRYLFTIPKPVIINRQNWCYDGGENYYRLGYVYRDHWYSPLLTGRNFSAQGELSDLPRLCSDEVEALIKHEPGYYQWGKSE